MDKQMLVNAVKSVRTAAKRHSPEILTGIGIAGMITTTIMKRRATYAEHQSKGSRAHCGAAC